MITNERQYKITRKRIEALKVEIGELNEMHLIEQGIDPVVIEAQKRSLQDQLAALERQVARYDELRRGTHRTLLSANIADIGEKLIEARISRNLSQKELASRLDMKEQQIQRYEQEKYLSANLVRIASVIEALKLDFQARFEMREEDANEPAAPQEEAFDPGKLPLKVMMKRGWLRDIQLPDNVPRTDAALAMAFMRTAMAGTQIRALHRQRVGIKGKLDDYALLAWKARILTKAKALVPSQSVVGRLDLPLVKRVVELSQYSDGPVRAVELLRESGVYVVFEKHLPSTHLDGAAMLLDGSIPVIGMTLRHDRIDNFWFVLLHELGHVVCHRERGLADGFFDDESALSAEDVELEADRFAQNALIPDEVWKSSFVRFTKAKEQVIRFAKRCSISPAIVAGRIRKERGDYSIFSDLIGLGEVQKQIVAAGLMEG
jgi:HTH-type transcriptional regulator/antitoxin HigA